jgi:hypothetical protein
MVSKSRQFERMLVIKGLTLGMGLRPEVVSQEICPGCPFRVGFCGFMREIFLD